MQIDPPLCPDLFACAPIRDRSASADLLGLALARAAVIQDTRVGGIGANVPESGGIAVLLVDAHKLAALAAALARRHTLHDDGTLALRAALFGGNAAILVKQ